MLVKTDTDKTLKGHKLLIIAPWKPPAPLLAKLTAAFPGLQVVCDTQGWTSLETPPALATLPDETWTDVTILLTFNTLPTPEQAPRLEYVQLMSAGANHVLDKPMFRDTEAAFCTANGVHGPQISEWIISTYLAFEHRLPDYLQLQREARWDRMDMHSIEDSANKTIGILGYGSIGRQTARLARAMGMTVHAYTLHPRPTPESRRDRAWTPPGLGDPEGVLPAKWFSGASTGELHAFLRSGLDLLVVAAPLTGGTRGLLGGEEFRVLWEATPGVGDGEGEGPGATSREAGNGGEGAEDKKAKKIGRTFIANIARGPVMDTDALLHALNSGLIRGAALDVTDPEPLPDGHPLWGARNVIITPHVSGASTRYFERVMAILQFNLGRLAEGVELVNRVDRGRGY